MKNVFVIICVLLATHAFSKEYSLFSPDKKNEVTLNIDTNIGITVKHNSEQLFAVDNISLEIAGKLFSSERGKVLKAKKSSVNDVIYPEIKEKLKVINDEYNELKINFKGGYSLEFRAYDKGVSYRFVTSIADDVIVDSENFNLSFTEKDSIYFQPSNSFRSSYETSYVHHAIKDVSNEVNCCLPALVKKESGLNVLITESDLEDFPGLWLKHNSGSSLVSAHPTVPVTFKRNGNAYVQGKILTREKYIAKTSGSRTYPWRIFAIAETDADLISNTLVYQHAKPMQIEDASWIKPGVVIFDWWGRRNIYGVDFKSGVNTATAKYFIDFTAEFGFEYFLFDDGWSKQGDLLDINPNLDMEEVMAYAKKKGVKIMLWAIWNTFLNQQEEAWELFEKWGISGIKFDFMNRDDQDMVKFYHEIAIEAAKRNMVIDFHGAYKPAGLRRMFPNVLTREGLIEFEQNGGSLKDSPKHHNLLPYIRMVAGPMDYIPYTTHNSTKKNFRMRGDMPMGMGTRAHSMALFVILESPMQMFPDSPSDYYRERECTEFISKIPTEWDELKVLDAKLGEHTIIARKNGHNWYVGAITDWAAKEFEVSFDFLDDGEYQLEYIEDGINADTRAMDYKKQTKVVSRKDKHTIKLAPGGGWIARIVKKN